MKVQTLEIGGMSCGHCVMSVRNALSSTEGLTIDEVRIGSAKVSFDERAVSADAAATAVQDAGYGVLSTTVG
jgi:copper chaperone